MKVVEYWKREGAEKRKKVKEENKAVRKAVQEKMEKYPAPLEYSETLQERKDNKKHKIEMTITQIRPTYIKVHTKYLLAETLDVYQLP